MSAPAARGAGEAAATSFDPWELADTFLSDVRDPHSLLAEHRSRGEVIAGTPFEEVNRAARGAPLFTVLSHDACQQVLRDPATFSSDLYADITGVVMGHTILEMGGEEHRTHRLLVSPAFRRTVLGRWERELVRVVADELIDRIADRGRADLVRDLTFALPVRVIARILGLPDQDYAQFARWSIELLSFALNPTRGLAASAALRDYFSAVLAERRAAPADDLISDLAVASIEGQALTDEEIYAFLRLLLPAGVETTYRSSGNLIHALLTHTDQLAALRADRGLLPAAIEEGLRWEPPILFVMRRVTRDCELAGVAIPADSVVSVSIGAANRDPAHVVAADRFDIRRPNPRHLTFGEGPHICLGMHLARLETRVAVDRLLDRLPDLRLDPDGKDAYIGGVFFRSPLALPVRWD